MRSAALVDARTALVGGCATANTNNNNNNASATLTSPAASTNAQSALTQLCGGWAGGCWIDAVNKNGALTSPPPPSPRVTYSTDPHSYSSSHLPCYLSVALCMRMCELDCTCHVCVCVRVCVRACVRAHIVVSECISVSE